MNICIQVVVTHSISIWAKHKNRKDIVSLVKILLSQLHSTTYMELHSHTISRNVPMPTSVTLLLNCLQTCSNNSGTQPLCSMDMLVGTIIITIMACGSEPLCRNALISKWRLQSMYYHFHSDIIAREQNACI